MDDYRCFKYHEVFMIYWTNSDFYNKIAYLRIISKFRISRIRRFG